MSEPTATMTPFRHGWFWRIAWPKPEAEPGRLPPFGFETTGWSFTRWGARHMVRRVVRAHLRDSQNAQHPEEIRL